MTHHSPQPLHPQSSVAIIGGGFSGAAVAIHLAKAGVHGLKIFEPRAELGRGLAYDTDEPCHRINVPAFKMSLYADDPESFLRFSQTISDDDLFDALGQPFPRRQVFGAYVNHEISRYHAHFSHHQTRIVKVDRLADGWQLEDAQGQIHHAHQVVIATSHPPPDLPRIFAPLKDDERLFSEGAESTNLSKIPVHARVLVVGNGLTAADVIATLDRHGHQGPITALSRRGLRAKGHGPKDQPSFGDYVPSPANAVQLLQKVRSDIRLAEAKGLTWHAVLDQLRAQGQDIWQGLPMRSRRQIARHLRPFWDVHRFRIAPQVEQVLDQAIAKGQLSIMAGHLHTATPSPDNIRISYRPRHKTTTETQDFDAIIVTTGPAHGQILRSQPFLAHLAKSGHLHLCPTGLGILCDSKSRALGSTGEVQDDLYISGPLARGTFGELMGMPQVADHAFDLAQQLLTHVSLFNPKEGQAHV